MTLEKTKYVIFIIVARIEVGASLTFNKKLESFSYLKGTYRVTILLLRFIFYLIDTGMFSRKIKCKGLFA